MIIFKDKLFAWLDVEIQYTMSLPRKRALQEVKMKIEEIIKEETSKMKENKDA